MQQALEKNESGRVLTWEDGNRARGRVVPIATIDTALYGWCREYEERIGTICCEPPPCWDRVPNEEWPVAGS
jgi:surface antigen